MSVRKSRRFLQRVAHPEQPLLAAAAPEEDAPALEFVDAAAKRVWAIEYTTGEIRTVCGDASDVARRLFGVWPQGEFFPVPDEPRHVSFQVDGVELALVKVLD